MHMNQFRELKIVLAITIIGLFTVSVYHTLSLMDVSSASMAYQSIVIAAFAFVWGMMCWVSYEDPLRFRENIMVTVVGLGLLACPEVGLIVSGALGISTAMLPWGASIPAQDGIWTEVGVLFVLAFLLFYFRPQAPCLDEQLMK